MIALEQQPLATQIAGDACTGLRNGALLICGSGAGAAIGCGKTSLAHALCRRLQGWPTYAHVIIVDCVAFRGTVIFGITVDKWSLKWNTKHVRSLIHGRQPEITISELYIVSRNNAKRKTASSHVRDVSVKHVNACALIAIPK